MERAQGAARPVTCVAQPDDLYSTSQDSTVRGDEASVARAMANLVSAIGYASFSASLLDALRVIANIELCSVFAKESGEQIELVLAHGDPAGKPGFALQASQAYLRRFWRSDRQLSQASRSATGMPVVLCRRAHDIADPAYRAACYDQASVVERVSIVSPGQPCFVINGYRTAAHGRFAAAEVELLDRHAALLLAALRQHLRITLTSDLPTDAAALVGRLASMECRLSAREAEVVAAFMMGETQARVAAATSLSVATIVTYRRRAYGKLGVVNRLDLLALRRRLLAAPDKRSRAHN